MSTQTGALFDSETIDVMRRVLDEAIAQLPAELRSNEVRVEMATCILKAASSGERNVHRLRTAALLTTTTRQRMFASQIRRPTALAALASATAMSESVIMRLEKASVISVLEEEPKFSNALLSYLLARNARVEEDLVDQLFNSSEKRLARLLLIMANFGREGTPNPVIAKLSQETLAEMIGTTRSRVSSFMNKFRKLGFIKYNGNLEVHNSLLNVILHDKPQLRRGDGSQE
jgi:Crp-like helix-turn-helix domain